MTVLDDAYASEAEHAVAVAVQTTCGAICDLYTTSKGDPELLIEHVRDLLYVQKRVADMLLLAAGVTPPKVPA